MAMLLTKLDGPSVHSADKPAAASVVHVNVVRFGPNESTESACELVLSGWNMQKALAVFRADTMPSPQIMKQVRACMPNPGPASNSMSQRNSDEKALNCYSQMIFLWFFFSSSCNGYYDRAHATQATSLEPLALQAYIRESFQCTLFLDSSCMHEVACMPSSPWPGLRIYSGRM